MHDSGGGGGHSSGGDSFSHGGHDSHGGGHGSIWSSHGGHGSIWSTRGGHDAAWAGSHHRGYNPDDPTAFWYAGAGARRTRSARALRVTVLVANILTAVIVLIVVGFLTG